MEKRQRNYKLFIGATYVDKKLLGSGFVTEIGLPFTVEFDVNRNTLASANEATIRVYNLSETVRRRIYKDSFSYNVYKVVELKAGYGDNLSTIFKGNIREAHSVREGTNYITTITAQDGGDALISSQINQSYQLGTPKKQIINDVVNSLNNTTLGAIGEFEGTITRGMTLSGNSAETLSDLTDGGFFIDSEKAYCLNEEECVQGAIPIINSDTGLLGTPLREETKLMIDIIFEPRIRMAQALELNSATEKNFNGQYKVISLKHRGMISDSISGTAITSIGLLVGPKTLKLVD